MNKSRAGRIAAAVIPVVLLTAALTLLRLPPGSPAGHHNHRPAPLREYRSGRRWYSGVALPSLSGLTGFRFATDVRPQIVSIYTAFGTSPPAREIRQIAASGALPLIQVNFRRVSLAAVLAGRWDRYLGRYGAALTGLHLRVALSYGHEPNGTWYPWGCTHVAPAIYRAAWRHIRQRLHAADVIWVWSVNAGSPASCPVAAWYPGSRYVTWIGVDGYLRTPHASYRSVFGRTVAYLRRYRKPVLITEAGVRNGPDSAQRLRSLFYGARASGVLGIVYFNARAPAGDYRLQHDRPALQAYRQLSRQF